MKVAVTGGTGCLGQPLVERLVDDGLEPRLLVLRQYAEKPLFEKSGGLIHGDLGSREALNLLTKNSDVVFHLAGKVHAIRNTIEEEKELYKLNVEGTKSLLDASRTNKVKRVIFYSTVGVYGKDADLQGDELSPCQPASAYAKSKYQAEQMVLNAGKNGGPEGVVLRFPVAYGAFDRGNVASLIRAIYKQYFFYFGDGKALRSMISSKNAAEAAYKAAFEPRAANRVFCVTDGNDYKVQELVECICSAFNMNRRFFHMPILLAEGLGKVGDFLEKLSGRPVPVTSDKVRKLSRPLTFSCDRAKKELGYEPKDTLMEGITREVKWLKAIHGWK